MASPETIDNQEPPDPHRPASATPTQTLLESETPGGSMAAGHDPYAALRIGGFRLYMLGWIVLAIGQQVQSVAVQWQIFQRMHVAAGGALALGLIGGVQALPLILLALPAGHLADRFDRRKIIIASLLFAFMCSIGLAIVSHLRGPVALVYLLLFLGATALAVGWPARSALVPQLVPAHVFSNAATWNSSAFQVASVAGPAVGGLIVSFNPTAAYLFDAGCAISFALLLIPLRCRPAEKSREPATLSSLAAGLRFVFRTKVILGAITLDLFAVLLGGATYLLPLFASDILHVDAVGFGWLRAAPAIGAFLMAMVIAHLPPMKKAGAAMLWSVAGFGLATLVFALSRSFALSLVALALTGAFDNVSVVVRHTLVQMLPPERMRGRVSAVNNVFIGASNEIGGLESGVTAWLFALALGPVGGAIASVAFGGIGAVVVVALVAIVFTPLRRFGSLQDARPIEEIPEPVPQ
ncbi:MAG TPA: MFS transporter [Tepidisphaeraceae bacterium]|nr:MFS transporter [Tepidisphaeraceae bacterium]